MNSTDRFENRVPEGLPCGQFVYAADGSQKILYADINVIRLFGCETFEELMAYTGGRFAGMIHPDDLEEAERSINAQTLESGHRHDYIRYRVVTRQGTVRYVEGFGHIVFSEDGRAYYYVFIADVKQEEYFNEYYNSFAEGQIDAMNWKVDRLTGLKNIVAFREELLRSLRFLEDVAHLGPVREGEGGGVLPLVDDHGGVSRMLAQVHRLHSLFYAGYGIL